MEIDSYDELQDFVEMWMEKAVDLLVVHGPPGTGKTWEFLSAIQGDGEGIRVSSHVSPLGAYKHLYRHRGEPVVFDDVTGLLDNEAMDSLFRQLGDTYVEKTLEWRSETDKLGDVPKMYDTTSNLAVVCNDAGSLDVEMEALSSRGFVTEFRPSRDELVSKMETVAGELETGLSQGDVEQVLAAVTGFIETGEAQIGNVNLRSVVKGVRLMEWDRDTWRNRLLRDMGMDRETQVLLEVLDRHERVEDAAVEFRRETGLSRTTFFNRKRRLERGSV